MNRLHLLPTYDGHSVLPLRPNLLQASDLLSRTPASLRGNQAMCTQQSGNSQILLVTNQPLPAIKHQKGHATVIPPQAYVFSPCKDPYPFPPSQFSKEFTWVKRRCLIPLILSVLGQRSQITDTQMTRHFGESFVLWILRFRHELHVERGTNKDMVAMVMLFPWNIHQFHNFLLCQFHIINVKNH